MSTSPILSQLLTALKNKENVALATIVVAKDEFASALGNRALFNEQGIISGVLAVGSLKDTVYTDIQNTLQQRRSQTLTYAEAKLQIFVEVQHRPPCLIIVGAGHVAQPLAPLGKMIGFEVVVLDDRPQYANKQRFPLADKVIAAPFATTLRAWPIDNNTYIVLVTRGHKQDVDCLLEIIDTPVRYIGMIGSKRRIKGVFELLQKEQGISKEKLARVYAPIGLDIGAETPAEIAICIIAEIINHYRGGRAESLSDALRRDWGLALHPARKKG